MPPPSLFETFKMNPIFFAASLVCAVFGLAFILLGLLSLAKSPKGSVVLGVLALLAGLSAAGAGVVGRQSVHGMIDQAVTMPGLGQHYIARMRADGDARAAYTLDFGLAAAALPLLGGALILVLGAARMRRAA